MSTIIYLGVVLAVVLLDWISKYIAVAYLKPISSIPIIKDVLHLTYVENRGAAFGMLQNQRWIFMVISTIVIAVLIFVIVKFGKRLHPLMMTGISFALGGGIGNMIDRTLYGYVVDFIDFTLIDFAVFNLADSFVCVGVGLMVLDILLGKSNLDFLEGKKKNAGIEDETDS